MRYRIGIDAGGTKVAYGLFDEKNVLVDRFQHPTPITADGPAFCDLVIESLHGLLRKTRWKCAICRVSASACRRLSSLTRGMCA